MNSDAAWSRLCRFLDGALTPNEQAELKQYLRSNPDLRRGLAQLLYQRAQLVELGEMRRLAGPLPVPSTQSAEPARAAIRFGGRRLAGLAVAAGLLLAAGVWLGIHRITDASRAVAVVLQQDDPNGAVRTGDRLHAGTALSVGAGHGMRIRLSSGAEIDLNENTRLGLSDRSASVAAGRLEAGDIYCSIPRRKGRVVPFAVETMSGHRFTATGTVFELCVDGSESVLRVEEGRVRAETRLASRTVGALEQLQIEGDGSALDPTAIGLHEIARWKFKQDAVPVGAIVFSDDFEAGLGKWGIVGGEWGVVKERGRAGNHLLRLKWKRGEQPGIHLRLPVRHESYQVTFKMMVGTAPRVVDCSWGLGFATNVVAPDEPASKRAVEGEVVLPSGGKWIPCQAVVISSATSGTVVSDDGAGSAPRAGTGRLGLVFRRVSDDATFYFDDMEIRKPK